MPYQVVKTKEYSCYRCNYKWIARKNGVEKQKPKFCPKCKTWMWDKKPIYEEMVAGNPTNEKLVMYSQEWNEEHKRYRLRNSTNKS